MKRLRIPTLVAGLGLLAAACTGGTAAPSMLQELGAGEGELNLIIWPGYAEEGAVEGFDWVTPFEEETGCIVNAQTQADSATGVRMLQSGEFDGVLRQCHRPADGRR